MALIAMGIFFITWAAFQLPAPMWLPYSLVWLAGIIAFVAGWIDLRLAERRER